MNKLKEIRLKKHITQETLSMLANVSIQNIKHIEKENFDFSKCRYETLDKLAKALKVDIKTFLK